MFGSMLLAAALAHPAMAQDEAAEEDMNAGYDVGARGGVSVPINGRGLACPASLEAGLEFPSDVSLGVRMSFQFDPPEIFGIETPAWGLGPLVDLRYHHKANKAVALYPMAGPGFLFGVSDQGNNVALPLMSLGAGARIRPGGGGLYITPELGLTNFTVPYMGVGLGFVKPPPKQEPPMTPRAAPQFVALPGLAACMPTDNKSYGGGQVEIRMEDEQALLFSRA